jgi:hypothetical protein
MQAATLGLLVFVILLLGYRDAERAKDGPQRSGLVIETVVTRPDAPETKVSIELYVDEPVDEWQLRLQDAVRGVEDFHE